MWSFPLAADNQCDKSAIAGDWQCAEKLIDNHVTWRICLQV